MPDRDERAGTPIKWNVPTDPDNPFANPSKDAPLEEIFAPSPEESSDLLSDLFIPTPNVPPTPPEDSQLNPEEAPASDNQTAQSEPTALWLAALSSDPDSTQTPTPSRDTLPEPISPNEEPDSTPVVIQNNFLDTFSKPLPENLAVTPQAAPSTELQEVPPTSSPFGDLFAPSPSRDLVPHEENSTPTPFQEVTSDPTTQASQRKKKAQAAKDQLHKSLENIYARSIHNQNLWQYVHALTALVAKDPELSTLNSELLFTRDQEINKAQLEKLRSLLLAKASREGLILPSTTEEIDALVSMVYDEVTGISVLGPLWRDDDVTEIIVNSYTDIRAEIGAVIYSTGLQFPSLDHAKSVARSFATKISGRSLSATNPMLTAELPGARVTLIGSPIAKSGIGISLRKFKPLLKLKNLIEDGAFSEEMRDFLALAVKARATIVVSGGTGTGKTTILNTLSAFIPPGERVITIEDAFELSLANDHVFAMQSKEAATINDTTVFGLDDIMTITLRLRPDRIIVGEIRQPGAAQVFLDAAGTGHEGSLTTVHARSAVYACTVRLPSLLEQASNTGRTNAIEQVTDTVHLVIQLARKYGRYYISEIVAVDRKYLNNGVLTPRILFKGELDATGHPVFHQVSVVEEDTELGRLIEEHKLLNS